MILHKDHFFSIYFGDARHKFIPASYKNNNSLLSQAPFSILKRTMKLKNLLFLHQVHGTQGLCINKREPFNDMNPFMHDGDFIITNSAQLGIGIASADCLPIVMYDNFNNAIAIIHAGWRGTMQKIVSSTLDHMNRQFGTNAAHIKIFFGPCARVCCYTVNDDMLNHVEHFHYADKIIKNINGQLFLDLVLFNQLQLQELGISSEAFHLHYNACTICDTSFCSYRRQGGNPERHMTVVSLT